MMPKIYDTKRVYSNGSESTIPKIYHAEDLLEMQKFDDKKNIRSMKIKDLKWQGCNESIKLKICEIVMYQRFMIRRIYGSDTHIRTQRKCKSNDK